jgi:membrane-associated protease RseP (regulator of RpoE activity)
LPLDPEYRPYGPDDLPPDPVPVLPGAYVEPVPYRSPARVWLHALLLLLTLGTTTIAGVIHYAAFASDFLARAVPLSGGMFVAGFWYSLTILAILGAHEMGHYLACRYYGVDASLPYFLPAPLPLTGTLGAFIKIRAPIRSKRVLFDIGVAGPIAGFLVAVPALFMGVSLSRMLPLPESFPPDSMELGEPLLFQFAAWIVWGAMPDGYSLNLHPMGFAAWFGLLATALNLFPIGQLDGGHISYAVLGPRSTLVTLGTLGAAIVLAFFSTSWIVWTVLMIAMLVTFGPRHPRVRDEHVPLDPARIVVAVLAAVMFAVCFTPFPIEPLEILRTP